MSAVLIQGDDRTIDIDLGINYNDCADIQVDVVVNGVVITTYKKSNSNAYKVFLSTSNGNGTWAYIKLYRAETATYTVNAEVKLQVTLSINDTGFASNYRNETQLINIGNVGKRYT